MTDKLWRKVNEKGYLSSLWTMKRDDERKLDFHGGFIPGVPEGLILRHTKPGDWVWDCFAGSGTTWLVADSLDRQVFLTDLNPTMDGILRGDVCNSDWRINGQRWQFDLVIAHPPYYNIVSFSDNPADLSNCPNIGEFLIQFNAACQNINRHLKSGGFLGLVIGDIWVTREQAKATGDPYGYFPLGFRCMEVAMGCIEGAILTATVVKDINDNYFNSHRRNLLLSRFYRWGTVEFKHEYIFSIQKGK